MSRTIQYIPRTSAAAVALLGLAALPAAAEARPATTQLKGTVVGSPYVAGPTRSAVPVLISKQSAKRAGMRSPVGVLILPRRRAVRTPEGDVLPGRLRLGDRWKGRVRLARETRRAVYARIALSRIDVYRRSKTLSTAELELLLQQTRTDLAHLQGVVRDLALSTASQFASLRAEVFSLRADLAAMRRDLNALGAQVTTLASLLESVRAALEARIDALDSDVGVLRETLTGLLTRTQAIEDRLAAVEASVASLGARVTSAEGTISSLQGALDTTTSSLQGQITSLSNGLITTNSTVSALSGTVDALGTSVSTIQGQVSSLDGIVNGPSGLVHDVEELCALTILGVPLATACV